MYSRRRRHAPHFPQRPCRFDAHAEVGIQHTGRKSAQDVRSRCTAPNSSEGTCGVEPLAGVVLLQHLRESVQERLLSSPASENRHHPLGERGRAGIAVF